MAAYVTFQHILVILLLKDFPFYYYYYRLRNLLTVFFVSCDVVAISRLFSAVYITRQDFIHSESEIQSVIWSIVQSEIVGCSKKVLFSSDCCYRSQAIILVVLVLVSL